jgi:hypothetical protein
VIRSLVAILVVAGCAAVAPGTVAPSRPAATPIRTDDVAWWQVDERSDDTGTLVGSRLLIGTTEGGASKAFELPVGVRPFGPVGGRTAYVVAGDGPAVVFGVQRDQDKPSELARVNGPVVAGSVSADGTGFGLLVARRGAKLVDVVSIDPAGTSQLVGSFDPSSVRGPGGFSLMRDGHEGYVAEYCGPEHCQTALVSPGSVNTIPPQYVWWFGLFEETLVGFAPESSDSVVGSIVTYVPGEHAPKSVLDKVYRGVVVTCGERRCLVVETASPHRLVLYRGLGPLPTVLVDTAELLTPDGELSLVSRQPAQLAGIEATADSVWVGLDGRMVVAGRVVGRPIAIPR